VVASAYIVFYFRQSTKAFPPSCAKPRAWTALKEWQIFLFVYVPVMRSTYAAAFIIVFMAAWNNFLWPLIVLQSPELKTITLVLSSLGSAYFPDFGVIMLAAMLATLPTLVASSQCNGSSYRACWAPSNKAFHMRTVTKLVSGWTFHTSFSSELIAKAAAGEAVRLPHNAVDLDMTYFDERAFQKEFAYQYTLAWQPAFAGRESGPAL